MRKALLPLLLVTPLIAVAVAAPATAAPGGAPGKPLKCFASDKADVSVDRRADTVAITDDPSTGGNNFGCLTDIAVVAGDTVTFSHDTTCGGGVPRVFLRYVDRSNSTNTFDFGSCTSATADRLGTASYTLIADGTIDAFAFINDRGDSGTVTYSDLVIDGNRIDF